MGENDDLRDVIRQMIQHEDTLRDQRLGWMLTLNGFLFAALGFAWSNSRALAYILGGFGVFVAISSFTTLRVSKIAIDKLRALVPNPTSPPPVVALTSDDFDQVEGAVEETGRGFVTTAESKDKSITRFDRLFVPRLYAWNVLPGALGAAWIGVLIARAVSPGS